MGGDKNLVGGIFVSGGWMSNFLTGGWTPHPCPVGKSLIPTLCSLLWKTIVGPPPPPPPTCLLKEGRTFQKLSHLGGQNFLLERGDKPKRGGADVEISVCVWGGGGCNFFYYCTVQFNCICILDLSLLS